MSNSGTIIKIGSSTLTKKSIYFTFTMLGIANAIPWYETWTSASKPAAAPLPIVRPIGKLVKNHAMTRFKAVIVKTARQLMALRSFENNQPIARNTINPMLLIAKYKIFSPLWTVKLSILYRNASLFVKCRALINVRFLPIFRIILFVIECQKSWITKIIDKAEFIFSRSANNKEKLKSFQF